MKLRGSVCEISFKENVARWRLFSALCPFTLGLSPSKTLFFFYLSEIPSQHIRSLESCPGADIKLAFMNDSFVFIYYWSCHVAYRILVPWPGTVLISSFIGNTESQPLDHQGSPSWMSLMNMPFTPAYTAWAEQNRGFLGISVSLLDIRGGNIMAQL